jgi:type II secretory ATPase GspE/PulE/Tfp pilus assembly ATPase PilB-like protein
MAGMKPERTLQTGALRLVVDTRVIDTRVETLPSEVGEHVIVWLPEDHGAQDQARALLQRYSRIQEQLPL